MAISLRQKARAALGRSNGTGGARQTDSRTGEVLWVHATNAEQLSALGDIGCRLKTLRPDLLVVASVAPALANRPLPEGCDIRETLPPGDSASAARQFLEKYHPDICLWAGGGLRSNLLRAARDRNVELLLVDIRPDEVPARRRRWLTDQTQRMIECFSAVYVSERDSVERIQRLGLDPDRITLTTQLRSSITPPGCHPDELVEVNDMLGGRPVWLAARAEPEEFATILDSHRIALRHLHRLLLVIAVDCESDADTLEETLRDSGLRYCNWGDGDMPNEHTQVLVTCAEDGLGLWYRVAPVSLIAGTLEPAWQGHCPMEALSLGSAVLFGPGIRRYRDLYARLEREGAAVRITGRSDLAAQVALLTAPDKAAAQALAGWGVVTEGAKLTDLLIEQIQMRLDAREVGDASA